MDIRKLFFTVMLVSQVPVMAGDEVSNIVVKARNTLSEYVKDYPVVVRLDESKCGGIIRSAKVVSGGKEIACQLDDFNQDGVYDELAFLADIGPRSVAEYTVELSSAKSDKTFQSRVFAELLLKDDSDGINKHITSITAPGNSNIYSLLYHHGPALESELVAYRLYFNDLQTPDIYGKFNKGFEIEESQFYPSDEQLAKGFGDDVLRVFDTCGAGGFRGWNGKEATPISPVATRTESILAYGPLRAVAEIKVRDWKYNGEEIDATMRYTLFAGHRDLHVEVFFSGSDNKTLFAAGIQNIKDSKSFADGDNLLGCWGTDWPVNDTVKYAKETVGLGIYVPQKYIRKQHTDTKNYLFVVEPDRNNYLDYYATFTSRKERFGFKNYNEWFEYLKKWRKEIENGVIIELHRDK